MSIFLIGLLAIVLLFILVASAPCVVDTFPLNLDQRVLALKVETTTGDAIALADADAALNAYNPEIIDETEMARRQAGSTSSSIQAIPGGYRGQCTFRTDLVGGTAGDTITITAPKAQVMNRVRGNREGVLTEQIEMSLNRDSSAGDDELSIAFSGTVPLVFQRCLLACGMQALTAGTYTFVTGATNQTTLTMGLYEDGLLRKLTGAQGNFVIQLPAPGQQGFVDFTFVGKYAAEADTALLTPTYPEILPPRWSNANGCVWGSYNLLVSSATIDARNQLYMRPDANATDESGFRSAVIPHREPMATLDPEAVLVATKAWHSLFRASTEDSLTITVGS